MNVLDVLWINYISIKDQKTKSKHLLWPIIDSQIEYMSLSKTALITTWYQLKIAYNHLLSV